MSPDSLLPMFPVAQLSTEIDDRFGPKYLAGKTNCRRLGIFGTKRVEVVLPMVK